jgi:multicomponent Na+:H+ antiporter subunit B
MIRALTVAFLVILAIPMLWAVSALPPRGAQDTPVHTHVSARYLAHGPDEAGADNLVTAVLLNYRSLDTFGEVVVIFTALAAALAVLLVAAQDRAPGAPADASRMPASPVVLFAVRVLTPFIAMFGVFIMLKGHVSPGGGFQGGAVLAALVIVLGVVLGVEQARRLIPRRMGPWLRAAGPVAFFAVGLLGLLLTGYALGYPTDPALHLPRELMLMALEVGIAVGGATILASVFLALEDL